MKILVVDDEHELYKRMFSDLFKETDYDIEEIPRMTIPGWMKPIYKVHFNDRINRHLWLPFKNVWNNFYTLHKYSFDASETYYVLFMNGSLRYHFSRSYLKKLKLQHPNVRLVMILYDSFSNPTAQRSIKMIPEFDYVFSFDQGDCERHGFERIYSTFSKPDFVNTDKSKSSSAFFIGFGIGRLQILQRTFEKISSEVNDCKFYIAGVKANQQKQIEGVQYNVTMPYAEELQMAYNTDCIVEIVKEGQTGVSLRTCEAIAFNKKLLTNNQSLLKMPFYDERYMQVFKEPEEIDLNFIKKKTDVHYDDTDYFSPVKIIDRLAEIDKVKKESI
ncbi:MAG: hypothetical protein PHX08_12435 [Lachnospiraceae bacterium]|nr:hypothetical protein [Lachnospiraceae bacterium]